MGRLAHTDQSAELLPPRQPVQIRHLPPTNLLTTTNRWVYSRSQEISMVVLMDRQWLRKLGYDEDEISLLVEVLSGPTNPEETPDVPEPVWASATLDTAAAA